MKIASRYSGAPAAGGLAQHPTPAWAAAALIDRYFTDLVGGDVALEPTCGPGHFLQAIPPHTEAVGVEIDPLVADAARRRTGRRIITADILQVTLDFEPTVIIGNPPFRVGFIDSLIQRSRELLRGDGRMGLILPAYYFTPAKVNAIGQTWSIRQELLPRQLFGRMIQPIVFALFSRSRRPTLVGFALFGEAAAVQSMDRRFREVLRTGEGSVWRRVVDLALEQLGGEADLQQIYRLLEGRRPTPNPFWQEKVRQICQLHFVRVAPGRYARKAAA